MPLPLDMPDDYPWLPSSTRYPLSDLGELATRLGSPVTFDRRGEVMWYDVGDKGLSPYATSTGGTGGLVRVDAFYSHMGGYNIFLQGGSDVGRFAYIEKKLSTLTLDRAGIEVGVAMYTLNDNLQLGILKFVSGIYHRPVVYFYGQTGQIKYLNASNVEILLDTVGLFNDPYGIEHHIKLVVDYNLGKYVRLLYNDKKYDLSGLPYYKTTATDVDQHRGFVRLVSRSGQNDSCSIGHMILTGNEP